MEASGLLLRLLSLPDPMETMEAAKRRIEWLPLTRKERYQWHRLRERGGYHVERAAPELRRD